MGIEVMQGLIKRRLLINYSADPRVVERLLPGQFRPKLHRGCAWVGICLIRLEHMRPKHLPEIFGMASENAAHRIAVEWTGDDGVRREGVYIPRRDTNSLLNRIAGGRLFPGEHHAAEFQVKEDGPRIQFEMHSRDGNVRVRLKGEESQRLPKDSVFASLEESSDFYAGGSLGYSPTHDAARWEGIRLKTREWCVHAFDVSEVRSSYFEDKRHFPPGTVRFDHALIMRNVNHEWQKEECMCAEPAGAVALA